MIDPNRLGAQLDRLLGDAADCVEVTATCIHSPDPWEVPYEYRHLCKIVGLSISVKLTWGGFGTMFDSSAELPPTYISIADYKAGNFDSVLDHFAKYKPKTKQMSKTKPKAIASLQGERKYMEQDEFTRYVAGPVNEAREEHGLDPIDPAMAGKVWELVAEWERRMAKREVSR